jgi:tRNA pseudouridine38-40 synthase
MKEPRGSLGVAASSEGILFALAGSGVDSNLSTCEYLDLRQPEEEQEWKFFESVEVPRHALAGASTNQGKKIYCIGGWKYGTVACTSVDCMDLGNKVDGENVVSKKWVQCAPMLAERRLHGTASVDNCIYVFGGLAAGSHKPLTSSEVYDEEKDEWKRIADLPVSASCGACSAMGQVYVVVWGLKKFGVFRYDTVADKYVHMSPLPCTGWFGFAVTAFETKIYLVGGSASGKWVGYFYSYDVLEGTWERLPPLPFVRRRLAATVYSSERPSQGKLSKRKIREMQDASVPKPSPKDKDCATKKAKVDESMVLENFEKVAFVVEYDGTDFHGFQALEKKGLLSVQESLEDAVRRTTTLYGRVNSAGRTDSGTHSLGMVVTAMIPKEDAGDLPGFSRRLDSRLRKDISIRYLKKVGRDFNPRNTASKQYTYRLALGQRCALGRQYVWDVSFWKIDVELLKAALDCFVGRHDFTSFIDKKNSKGKDNNLEITRIAVTEQNGTRNREVAIEFVGKSFRHKQVRKMVACAVDVSRGKLSLDRLKALLHHPDGAPTPSAPAHGLVMSWVKYAEDEHKDLTIS